MSKYVTRTDANEQLWRPVPERWPETGYLLFQEEDGRWGWIYIEPGEDDEFGPHFEHRDQALQDIADNWSETGSHESGFVAVVQGQASRARFERERGSAEGGTR